MQELQFPCDKLTARTDPDGFVSIVQMQEMAAKLDNLFQSLKTPVKVADYKFNNVAVVFTLVYKDTEKSTKRFEVVSIVLRKLLLNRLDCPTPDRVSVVKGAVHLSCP